MSITLQVTEETNGFVLSQQTYILALSSGAVPTARTGVGSPLNVVTPSYLGQLYFDTNTYGSVYFASGTASSSWIELLRNI
jgi:hypothetical protein